MGAVAVGPRGLLPGRALQRFVEQIIDKDGLTVLKTVEVPQLPSRLVVQFMDKVVDVPVVVRQGPAAQKMVEFPQLQFLDKGNRRCGRPCDHAATFVSSTVEVPQIQFTGRVVDIPASMTKSSSLSRAPLAN